MRTDEGRTPREREAPWSAVACHRLGAGKADDLATNSQTHNAARVSDIESLWPHAPPHHLGEGGAYMVTASTLYKAHYFRQRKRLYVLERGLLKICAKYGWPLEAWAVFSNHYHFVANSPAEPKNLRAMLTELHSRTARSVNGLDGRPGRKIWYNFRETQLTFQRSYLARLNYVTQNPVKHGLVSVASQYLWCSASWLERTASESFQRTLKSCGMTRIRVDDDFEPVLEEEPEEEDSAAARDAVVRADLDFESDLG
jgi:putative transposase